VNGSRSRITRALAALVFLLLIVPAGARAAPCPDWSFTAPGASKYHAATIPNASASGHRTLPAIVLRPKKAGKKKLPGVLLLHGRGGNRCALWWAARLLASKGFETLVVTYPSDGPKGSGLESAAATSIKGVLAWFRSTANPYRKNLNRNKLGLVGHSLGALVAADLQQDAGLPYLKTIVAFDNLRAYLLNDVSGGVDCDPTMLSGPITPRLPALSLGSETACPTHPSAASKRTGYDVWRAAGVNVMEAVIAGIRHPGFSGGNVNPQHATLLKHVAYYTVPWLKRWLKAKSHTAKASFEAALTSQAPLGIPVTQMLFDPANLPATNPPIDPAGWVSAAFLPSKECTDLRACP
jgi:pimeloyl-ACP methyl ester carboxylesterase